MGKNCISCGKNIGILTVRIPLLDNEEVVICLDCFNKMPQILNELYQKKINPTKTELLVIKEEVMSFLKENNFNKDTINVVAKFLDDKKTKAKNLERSESGIILKKCPVCNKNLNYDTEVCSDCGYNFAVSPMIEHAEIAEIYNARLDQYKNNPFYEYDYIVVRNKLDGTSDQERISEIIKSHAMQGWRLVTMYSNEIGQEAIAVVAGLSTFVTSCEDVLVFERCIRR